MLGGPRNAALWRALLDARLQRSGHVHALHLVRVRVAGRLHLVDELPAVGALERWRPRLHALRLLHLLVRWHDLLEALVTHIWLLGDRALHAHVARHGRGNGVVEILRVALEEEWLVERVLHGLDGARRQLDEIALEVELRDLLQQVLVAVDELAIATRVEVLQALGPLADQLDHVVEAVPQSRCVLLEALHVLELGQLLLLGVVELLLQDSNVHLALCLQLLEALAHVDGVRQLDLDVFSTALHLAHACYRFGQLLLGQGQLLALEVPLVVDRSQLDAIVLDLVPQVEQLGFGVLQLRVEPECRRIVTHPLLRCNLSRLDLRLQHFFLGLKLSVDQEKLLELSIQHLHRRLVLVDDSRVDGVVLRFRWRRRFCLLLLRLLVDAFGLEGRSTLPGLRAAITPLEAALELGLAFTPLAISSGSVCLFRRLSGSCLLRLKLFHHCLDLLRIGAHHGLKLLDIDVAHVRERLVTVEAHEQRKDLVGQLRVDAQVARSTIQERAGRGTFLRSGLADPGASSAGCTGAGRLRWRLVGLDEAQIELAEIQR